MNLKQKIREVIASGDAKEAGRIAMNLRMGAYRLNGTPILFNYDDMMGFVAKATGRTVADVTPEWDGLLAEADGERDD